MEKRYILSCFSRWISGKIGLNIMQNEKIMKFNENEKFYKIYQFTPKRAEDSNFEYRVLTKELTNGKLELVSYNHKMFDGEGLKSGLVQATEIDKSKLPGIIDKLLDMTHTDKADMREIDLSNIESYAKQMEYLENLEGINEEFLI